MPDFFQGTEFWDFSLVDPDNRRPVDYPTRGSALAADIEPVDLRSNWRDGRIKQAVIRRLLNLRRRIPDLFASGDYGPLPVKGPLQNHIVAFSRSLGRTTVIVIVPRLPHGLLQSRDSIVLDADRLRNSTLALPEHLDGAVFRSLFSPAHAGPLLLSLAHVPFAVLYAIDSA
jgi:(1->4)-alpha-D-glucan 1-alpha-D-glucosylmutase